jgi:hypothetical protein
VTLSDFDYQPPADGSPAPSESPMTEVAIGGKTYRVPSEMAESINAERQAIQQPTPANPQPQTEAPNPQDDEAFWADPQAYIQQQIDQGIQAGMQQVQQRTQAQQAESQFWDKFYTNNPHLKKIDNYLKFTASQNVEHMKQFNGDHTKIANYIADLGNKELQKFGATPQTSGVFVEGSAQPTPVAPQSTQSKSNVTTMGDVLRKRRENRRKARLGA